MNNFRTRVKFNLGSRGSEWVVVSFEVTSDIPEFPDLCRIPDQNEILQGQNLTWERLLHRNGIQFNVCDHGIVCQNRVAFGSQLVQDIFPRIGMTTFRQSPSIQVRIERIRPEPQNGRRLRSSTIAAGNAEASVSTLPVSIHNHDPAMSDDSEHSETTALVDGNDTDSTASLDSIDTMLIEAPNGSNSDPRPPPSTSRVQVPSNQNYNEIKARVLREIEKVPNNDFDKMLSELRNLQGQGHPREYIQNAPLTGVTLLHLFNLS